MRNVPQLSTIGYRKMLKPMIGQKRGKWSLRLLGLGLKRREERKVEEQQKERKPERGE